MMMNLNPAAEALEHARYLVEEIGPRGSATPQEQAALVYFRQQLEKLALQVTTQDFSSPKSAWLPVGLCVLLSLFSLLISLPGGALLYVALALACAALYWALREVNLDDTLLNRLLSSGKSQNTWAIIPPAGEKHNTVILLAHLDSHRTPLIMQSQFFSKIFAIFSLLGYVSLAAVPLYLAARLVLGFANNLPLLLALAVVMAILSALILQADFTPYSPGANDNAASVGMALACARQYASQPLAHTELWILGSGCEEVGCYGIRRFLDCNRSTVRQARFIDLELIGRGEPSIVVREGLLFKQGCPPDLRLIAERAAERIGRKAQPQESPVYGESYILNKQGFASITLNAIPQGKPDAYWHTPRDTMDKLDPATLEMIFAWIKEILTEIDRRA